ncbi:hypothetical protein Cgig2_034126 [Carnegiea gigantea]|uniref:Uncharacterized protein n=1 Tax=Carnegiea gigantea TaxID=171969 RepID=A0A9Q1QH12_9CARY|nr:hypothetical protein Cgig2_034126 [Carnegiea gigantea]
MQLGPRHCSPHRRPNLQLTPALHPPLRLHQLPSLHGCQRGTTTILGPFPTATPSAAEVVSTIRNMFECANVIAVKMGAEIFLECQRKIVSQKGLAKHVKLCPTSPKSTPPPSLVDHILTLDECIYELQETADKLEYIMVRHISMPDGIDHNQAALDNRLTRLQNLLTRQFFDSKRVFKYKES